MARTLRNIFGNRWVLLALLLYAGSLLVLWRNPAFEGEEAMMLFVLFVVIFPLLAWIATLRAQPLPFDHQPTPREMLTLALYFLGLSLYLLGGPQFFDGLLPKAWLEGERVRFFIVLARKLIVFVLVPYALFRFLFGASLKDFGLSRAGFRQMLRGHLPVVLTVSAAILLFQYYFGGAVAPIRKGELSAQQLMLGVPLCFVWLVVEAGLVEEFCFRGLLQSRLAAWFKSDVTSVALMALIFGLAHAPGFIFRGAAAVESIGPNPTALDSVAYAVAILSVGGLVFGVIWARTKNLCALIVIHAAFDLLPNLATFVKTWRL